VLNGANDYGFAEVAKTCLERWTLTVSVKVAVPFFEDLCQDDNTPCSRCSRPRTRRS
jgi:hypothetical protein